jgi:hypothetical protein
MNWQPIATAPRDVAVFVTWPGTTSRAVGRTAIWSNLRRRTCIRGKFEDLGPGWVCYYTGLALSDRIDHWMPLPDPPKTESGE